MTSPLLRKLLCVSFVTMVPMTACKTSNGARVRAAAADDFAEPDCYPKANTWAGRMGMQLSDDAEGGARIQCIVVGTGIVHIGLKTGDRIVALNNGAEVVSAQSFEDQATALAGDKTSPIAHWEFSIVRNGNQIVIKPAPEYPGCGTSSFSDCGPLNSGEIFAP